MVAVAAQILVARIGAVGLEPDVGVVGFEQERRIEHTRFILVGVERALTIEQRATDNHLVENAPSAIVFMCAPTFYKLHIVCQIV